MCVCHVFAYFAFPLPSWWYIYNGGVYVCMYVTWSGNCALHLHQPALSPLSEWGRHFIIILTINHYTFSIKVMMRIVKIIIINWVVPIFIASEPCWAPKARSEAWRWWWWCWLLSTISRSTLTLQSPWPLSQNSPATVPMYLTSNDHEFVQVMVHHFLFWAF